MFDFEPCHFCFYSIVSIVLFCLFRKCCGLEMHANVHVCKGKMHALCLSITTLLHSFVVSVFLSICKNEVIRKVIFNTAVKVTKVSTIRSPF